MTVCEHLLKLRDEQIRQADEAWKNSDTLGMRMHKNMADGFELKIRNMTAQELGAEWKE